MSFFTITDKSRDNRIAGLDLVRAIAVLMVVFFHSRIMLLSTTDIPYIDYFISKIMFLSAPFGELGVEMFFVLSGYLIGSILIKEFTKETAVSFSTIKSFWIRRWFRTLPNYFLILSLNSLLYFYLFNKAFDWKFLFFIQNLFQPHPEFFAEAWSLSIEEWSYLLIPVCLLINISLLKKSSGNYQRSILITIILYILTFNIIRIINAFSPSYENTDLGLRKIVIFRLDAIAYGIFVAYMSLFHSNYIERNRKQFFILGLLMILATTLLSHCGFKHMFDSFVQFQLFVFFRNALLYTLIPIGFALIIPYAASIKKLRNKNIQSTVTHISLISYSMYLTHFTLIGIPFFFDHTFNHWYLTLAFYISYWVVVILASTFIYKYYEKPLTLLREKLK